MLMIDSGKHFFTTAVCFTALLLASISAMATTEKTEIFFQGPAFNPRTLAVDEAGNLYTALTLTNSSGSTNQFVKLTRNSNGTWTQRLIYTGFTNEIAQPSVVDAAGNLYGTTFTPGGQSDCGVVFELSPMAHGSWKETTLHTFPCFGSGRSGELLPLAVDSQGTL